MYVAITKKSGKTIIRQSLDSREDEVRVEGSDFTPEVRLPYNVHKLAHRLVAVDTHRRA